MPAAAIPEREIMHSIRLALGADRRVVLWRNDVGAGERDIGRGRKVHTRYGLCVGSSDLIGIVRCTVSTVCDDDGTHHPCLGHEQKLGRFFALEVKTEVGKTSEDQDRFIALVRSFGGFAAVVRSVDEARAAVDRAVAGALE